MDEGETGDGQEKGEKGNVQMDNGRESKLRLLKPWRTEELHLKYYLPTTE